MITSRDIKIRETKPDRLTIITTDKVKPKGFAMKGKGKARNKLIITTSNVEQFQKKRKRK